MARQSAEVWAKRVEHWRDSGLTAGEYAAEVGVNPKTLLYWSWRLRHSKESAPRTVAAPVGFVEVKAEPTAARYEPFELVLGDGIVIRVPATFDAAALRRLVAAVRS